MTIARPPGSVRVVGLLLATARRRAKGRRSRARDIVRSRTGRAGGLLGFGSLLSLGLAIGLSVLSGLLVQGAVKAGQRIDAERNGQIVVGQDFVERVRRTQGDASDQASPWTEADSALRSSYPAEGARLASETGGTANEIARRLHAAVLAGQTDRFVAEEDAAAGLANLQARGAGALLGLVALAWWIVMLVMQGEGLELDTQRRRHPMWEWVLSHPVRPAALFCAEMLAPLAANPTFWGAPLMPGILFGLVYGPAFGVLATCVVGIPMTVAAACFAKALEIAVLLRLRPRSRGAAFGLMGWLGTTTASLTLMAWLFIEPLATAIAGPLGRAGRLPWPWLGLMLGRLRAGPPSFLDGVLTCCLMAGVVAALSVALSVWAVRRGLGGASDALAPRPAGRRRTRFSRNPMHRKEWLWFARDRSAIVQVVLVPLSLAAMQLFNMRGLIANAGQAWNAICGAAILFGTYFLVVLGPKSLASEGPALWIAMTWPHGLEALLRAKARLWTVLSSGFVALPLCYAAYRFPRDLLGVVLVGLGWIAFGYSMALKTVTLVTVTGSSGEAERTPASRRWATYLGTFTFSIGVLTRQWPVAASGIVYSGLAGAAMWQNFRTRLPYLFDPWSERRPAPPTLMHAMVAIAALVDGGAVITGIIQAVAGPGWAIAARSSGYAVAAAVVGFAMVRFLNARDVRASAVWRWAVPVRRGFTARRRAFVFLVIGGISGAMLGGLAHLYLLGLHAFAWARAILDQPNPSTALPHYREWSFLLAVIVAPLAEEFLFRGLLYRALDREWGGWAAIGGSAAFFAIYHPVLSWLPVGLLGISSAMLFRKSGNLAPSVLLHMVYNAVVLF